MRKHSKWLWWIIIVVIIVVFVYWGSSMSRTGGSNDGPGNFGQMNGETITANKYSDAQKEVYLMYFFASNGSWPDKGRSVAGFDVERETYFRLFLIQKQEAMGVHVSEEALAKVASNRLRSMNRGNPVSPEVFAKQVLAPERLTLRDFERYLRHELGLQQMASVVGLGGELLTPQEMRSLYQRNYQDLQAQAVFFTATNYLTSISPTPEKVASFFTNQMARYRLPERVQVNYVKFPLSNFLAEAIQKINENTNLNELLDAAYQQRGTNYYSDAKSPEEAKQRILKEEQDNLGLNLARKKASEFATELFDQTPVSPDNLVTLAKAKGLTPQVTPPFDADEPPAGLDVRADFMRAAFGLTDEEPFSQTLVGNDGAYLISLNKRLPSEVPSLDSIHDRVTQDYRFFEAAMAARKAGADFAATATNITSGPSFAAACAVAKVKPAVLPPFSVSTRELGIVTNHVSLSQFKQVAFSTAPGQMSPLQPSSDGAYVVFVQSKLPLDESQLALNLPAFERSVRQAWQSEAFNKWFNQEFEKVKPGIPYFAKKTELSGTPKP